MLSRRRHRRLPEWGIALLYAVAATVAALTLPRLEHYYLPADLSAMSAPVALAICSSITSGMIALTGIVFSLAFVMVQFSAASYSPRIVLWVSRDPVIWHSTGIFTATFLYAIGAMAWVDRGGSGRVPFFSGWVIVVLLLSSIAMLVALIQRIGLLQVNRMLTFAGDFGRQVIEETYQSLATPPSLVGPEELTKFPVSQSVVHSGRPRTLQALDVPALLSLANRSGGTVEVVSLVGDTLITGTTLLRVYGGTNHIDEEAWRVAFLTGEGRTFDQDPKYALRILVDIAIKALSPAINDPTTAVQALDQLQDLLMRLGRRRLEIGAIRNDAGKLKLIVPQPSWEDFLRLAFDEIRDCGATSVQVMRRMRALISDLIATLPPERHRELEHHRERLNATIARSFPDEEEKLEASVEDRQGLGRSRGR
jgi:uncharacterized membrane protein